MASDLKTRVRETLDRGGNHEPLLALVHDHYAAGGTPESAYEALQNVWLEFGFDDDEDQEENRIRDSLEYAMERVWYWRQQA